MSPTRIAATLVLLAAGMVGAFWDSARAANPTNYSYNGNQLTEIDFDDGTSIQYFYDENGNLIAKVPGNQSYTIMPVAGSGGAISPASSVSVASGGSQSFSITPNTGWVISQVLVDGASVGPVSSYTFTNVTHAHTIEASFSSLWSDTYPITATVNGGGGAIYPSYAEVGYGGSQSFIITPDNGYYITGVTVDGSSVGPVSFYTLSNVTSAHTIQVTFSDTYSITTSAGANGTIAPPSAAVDYGGSQEFEITAASGYSILDVQVDGISQGPLSLYTFTNVSANHTLAATFTQALIMNAGTGMLYQHLQDAYKAAQNGDRILVQGVQLTESFNANQGTLVTIDGGYTADFSSNPGYTIINGLQTISSGTVTWKNFVISGAASQYAITADAGPNGSISPPGATVNSGSSQTFNIVPNTGYYVADVQVDGVDQGVVTSYTFNNVTAPHNISATFAPGSYTITASAGANGYFSPPGATVNCGENQLINIVANTGYHVADVQVDGVDQGAITSYAFSDVTANHSISATFAINTYTVTPSAGQNGSISPSTSQTVNYNGITSFTVAPNTGYSIASVTGCGGTLSGNTFTTGPITANCAVSATFVINTYTVTPSAGQNGSISPSTAQTVNYDGTASFTVTPSTGYSIASVTGCGGTLSGNTFTTGQITGNCSVSATFAINTYTVSPSAGTGGSISPSSAQTVNYDGTTSFTVTPSTGYSIASVTGCGGTLSGNTYTTGQITGNCSVSASFSINSYTVSPSAGTGGSISPSTAQAVNYDGTTSFTVTPSTGYSIASVTGCGGTLSGSTFTTGQITGNCSVSATFAINTYTVTPSAGQNGSISPSTAQTVNYDGTTSFTVTPNTGYTIGSVTGCGGTLSGSTFTTGQITGNCAVSATFVQNGPVMNVRTGATYTSLQAAYNAALNGDTIEAQSVQLTENFTANQNISVTIAGGYNSGFSSNPGMTSLQGLETISSGVVTWNNFLIISSSVNRITASAGPNGSISPPGATVGDGGSQTFNIVPNTGYYIVGVQVDGVNQGAITSYTFNNVTAPHNISATFAVNTYTITASAGANGSFSPPGATVNYGGSQSFNIVPNTGYYVAGVQVDGVNQGAITSYTFSNVTASHSISATFAIDTYSITASAGANGSISPPVATVNYGGSQTFTLIPNTGYYVSDVVVDGTDQGAITSYTFNSVTSSHTISATFAIITYPITATAGPNGTISPASANVAYGASQTFSMAPNACYQVTDVIVDGANQGAIPSYTFSNVTSSHILWATFGIDTYTITTTVGANGSISPASPSVNCGSSQTFTITPNQGYSIMDVQVDGASQGPFGSYTFTNVTANHTLSATFGSQSGTLMNARTGGTYTSLQAAYNAALNGDTIEAQSAQLTENFTANRNISVTIAGGYISGFSSSPGTTTIIGLETISSGTVTWKNFIISN